LRYAQTVTSLAEPARADLRLPAVLHALSDPARLRIVRALAEQGERVCGSFELGLSKATRSHHLRVLREAGLTHTRLVGTTRHVTLRREDVDTRFPGLLEAVLAGAGADLAPA
jgi:DNA-binding transcriptional ArsR family regulator